MWFSPFVLGMNDTYGCLHWFYAMPTNRQLDHSFPAVLDIFGKGLNLPAPLDIQWPKCFQPRPDPRCRLVLRARHGAAQPLTPSAAYDPRASSPPLILTTLRPWTQGFKEYRPPAVDNTAGTWWVYCVAVGAGVSLVSCVDSVRWWRWWACRVITVCVVGSDWAALRRRQLQRSRLCSLRAVLLPSTRALHARELRRSRHGRR